MNEQSLPYNIKTEPKIHSKKIKNKSNSLKKHQNQSKNSARNIKSNLSISKSDKTIMSNLLCSPKSYKLNTKKFMPKECEIQCPEFHDDIFYSKEEDEELGKGLKTIGKELKQKIIGMQAGIKNDAKNFPKKFVRHHSSKNLTRIIKSLAECEQLKNKETKKNDKTFTITPKNNIKYRKLQKIKNIFDSMDEEEVIDDLNEGNIILEINGKFIFIFDSLILFSSLFSFFYVPISIANSDCFCMGENSFIKNIQLLIEIFYFLDIVISFFREYYDYEYKLNKNNKKIAIHYLKTNFKYDLIEAIPFNSINQILCSQYDKYKPDGDYCLYNGISGKFIVLKLMNCLKIMKTKKSMSKRTNMAKYKLFESVSESSWGKYIKISIFVLVCFLTLNMFVCFHIFIGKHSHPNWILLTKQQHASFSSLYISSLYFLIETFTTVGYGDIYCSCLTEYIFQIILLSIGVVTYSFIITIIGNYVNNESQAQIKHDQQLTLLEEIRIEYPQMPFNLYRKIHQHLESLSHQQKKCDFNILVNSLPYSIKNLVLFKVYDKHINNFHFFKDCENSDFISKILQSFIPVFSKKHAFIIHEDEIVENIVFVKEGSLSLKAAINLNHPEESIRKILYEKFSDIPDIPNAFEHRHSIEMDCNISFKNDFQFSIINKNTASIISSKQEAIIEQEIGKLDMGCEEDDDIENDHYIFLKILNISKNDNYGMIYMFLNKPSPLSLRVRSKRAEIFLLRKQDSYKIAKAYPNIWKKQFKNSYYNIISIKQLTFKILNNYCSLHGLTIKKIQMKETGKIALSKIQEIIQKVQTQCETKKDEIKLLTRKKKSSSKLCVKPRKFKTSLYNIKKSHKIIRNILLNKTSSLKLNIYNDKQLQKKKSKFDVTKLSESPLKRKIVKSKSFESDGKKSNSSSENDVNFIKVDNKKIEDIKNDKNKNEKEIFSVKIGNEKNEKEEKLNNKNNNLENSENFFEEIKTKIKKIKTKKHTKKNKKEYYKLLSMKLAENLNKLLEAFNQIYKNKINNINNINNSPIISTINTYLKLPDSINVEKTIKKFSLITVDNSFSPDKLSISKIVSFNFESSYKNINEISNGEYILNKSLQYRTQKFIRSFNNNLTKINYIKNNSFDDSNSNSGKKSFSVKAIKSGISKNINLNLLKHKNIIKEISADKRKLTNKSYIRFNNFHKKNNLNEENRIINKLQTIDDQNSNKIKANISDKNSNNVAKNSNSEIEYEFSNEIIKEKYSKISEVFGETKESKKEINSKKKNYFIELFNIQNKDSMKIDDKSIDDMIKKSLEKNNNIIKGFGAKKGWNFPWSKSCNIY